MRRRGLIGMMGNVSTLRYTTTSDMPAGEYEWCNVPYTRNPLVILDGVILSRDNYYRATVAAGVHECYIYLPGTTTLPDYFFNTNYHIAQGYIDEIHIEGAWTELGAYSILANRVRSLWLSDSITRMGASAIAQNANLVSINGVSDGSLLTLNLQEWSENNFSPRSYLLDGYAGGLRFPNLRVWGGPNGIYSAGMSNVKPDNGFDLDIGENLTTIYGGAIDRYWLKDLIVRATTPPTFIGRADQGGTAITFQSTIYGNIKVPAASVDAYKAAPGWSNYASYIIAI